MKPMAQIAELDNGYLVQLPPAKDSNVPRSIFCKDKEEVIKAIEPEFPSMIHKR